jgi:hypothetical protein
VKHPNDEVEHVMQRLIEAVRQGEQIGYPVSDGVIRSQIAYVFQLGRFEGRIEGIKEMAR